MTGEEASSIDQSPVRTFIRQRLVRPERHFLFEQWEKAVDRLDGGDLGGAVTAARTFLESSCKLVLDEADIVYDEKADLPKLYFLASSTLGIRASGQIDASMRAIFGAAATLVQSVAEMRNLLGDAHGRAKSAPPVSRLHAELTVNVVASVCCFLLTAFDRHRAAKEMRDEQGRIVLRFDKTTVLRLRDHARNARRNLPALGEKKPKPALWLVGDSGIYLMSNGSPAMSSLGEPIPARDKSPRRRLTAPAEGTEPASLEFDEYWPIHNAIAGGDDFCFVVPIDAIDTALANAAHKVIIVIDDDEFFVTGDRDFDHIPMRPD